MYLYIEYRIENLVTYVNGSDGRISNHISDVVYFSSGRSRRRGGRQHHFTGHPIETAVTATVHNTTSTLSKNSSNRGE